MIPSPAAAGPASGSGEEDIEALVREVEGVVRKADRELSLARLQQELLDLQGLFDRRGRPGIPAQGRPGALGQAMELASRLAAGGRFREGMVTLASVLRVVLSEQPAEAPAGNIGRLLLGGLESRPVPYLEAFVAGLAPRLAQMSRRQLWEWLRTLGSDGIDFLEQRICWRASHPRSGAVLRDGYLCHDGTERAIGFRTFCLWLDQSSRREPGH